MNALISSSALFTLSYSATQPSTTLTDWIEQCSYMGDDFYRSKDPTNSIKVLKEHIVHRQIKHTISRHKHKTQQIPSLH